MNTPFFFGGRIENPDFFVGRSAELRRIFTALEVAHTGQMQHISVVGPRRIGKSSLLYHVTQIYPRRLQEAETYRFAFVDLDDPRCHSQDGLLAYILEQFGLSHAHRVDLERFRELLVRAREGQRLHLVLCLDEFEHLTRRKEAFPNAFFDAWRALGANNHLAFLTASKTSLKELARQGDLTSPFFNIFHMLELGLLTAAEARQLAERGLHCQPPFTPAEVDEVLQLAGRHPARLQIAGQSLCAAKASAAASGKPVSRRAWKQAYRQQIAYTFGPLQPQPNRWRKAACFLFRDGPEALGRALLELLKRETISPATARLTGYALLALAAALLLGLCTLEDLRQGLAAWLCALRPGDCP